MLTIGQVQELTGVGKSTIRHWEKEFRDFLTSVRTTGNQRRFPEGAVERIETIRSLVEEQGLTLRGVRHKLERVDLEKLPDDLDTESDSTNVIQKLADLMSEHMMRRIFKES